MKIFSLQLCQLIVYNDTKMIQCLEKHHAGVAQLVEQLIRNQQDIAQNLRFLSLFATLFLGF
jgi:hypothetical protein